MDYGHQPGDELDPQAAATTQMPGQGEPQQPHVVQQPGYPPQAMAPHYYVPGVITTEIGPMVPAGFGPRFLAFVIDAFVLGILTQIFTMLAGVPQIDEQQALAALQGFMRDFNIDALSQLGPPGWVLVLSSFIFGAYYVFFHAYNHASLGKMALGLQVRQQDGAPLGLRLAFFRYVLYWLAAKLLYTAWLIPLDREKRTAYDALLKLNVFRSITPKK
ncbi:MAG: RDD family protein [bacterium]|nr:RDD family protein [bacterium]